MLQLSLFDFQSSFLKKDTFIWCNADNKWFNAYVVMTEDYLIVWKKRYSYVFADKYCSFEEALKQYKSKLKEINDGFLEKKDIDVAIPNLYEYEKNKYGVYDYVSHMSALHNNIYDQLDDDNKIKWNLDKLISIKRLIEKNEDVKPPIYYIEIEKIKECLEELKKLDYDITNLA